MADLNDDLLKRTELAIESCETNIAWFRKNKKQARLLHRTSQVAVIALGALTPVLIMSSESFSRPIPKWLQALPAAVSSIVAGLSVAFNPRENWVSRAMALEALQSELLKFKTKTSEFYSPEIAPQKALENFVDRVHSTNQEELVSWRGLQVKSTPSSTKED